MISSCLIEKTRSHHASQVTCASINSHAPARVEHEYTAVEPDAANQAHPVWWEVGGSGWGSLNHAGGLISGDAAKV